MEEFNQNLGQNIDQQNINQQNFSQQNINQSPGIDMILQAAEQEEHVSDIHLGGNKIPSFRINGDVVSQGYLQTITSEQMDQILLMMLQGDQEKLREFHEKKELDFSYSSLSGTPYRVNAYFSLGQIHIVLRKINTTALKLEDLLFQDIAEEIKKNVLHRNKGLYLVTGPTGSGKSTSLVAMINYINSNRSDNIITIEDPVEFIYSPDKCLISQREVGNDTLSFQKALKYAMREDPDIILVGEIRDRETAEAVLQITESGHVVFSTMHTPSAALTVNRFISFFPPDTQGHVCDRLSEVLLGVQAQTLVKTKDGSQRVGIYEVMFNTTAIRNNIRTRDIPQVNSVVETSSGNGMICMAKYAERLFTKGIIDEATYNKLADKSLGSL